jgi:hypothetical protein
VFIAFAARVEGRGAVGKGLLDVPEATLAISIEEILGG